jgi:hypothetical protein
VEFKVTAFSASTQVAFQRDGLRYTDVTAAGASVLTQMQAGEIKSSYKLFLPIALH